MRLGERGEDGDAAGRVDGVLRDDGRVDIHRGHEYGRKILASHGRRVRATILVSRSRRGKISQPDVKVPLAISPEVLDLGHPSDQLADVGEEGLLLERARLVVGLEWRHRLRSSEEDAHVVSFRLDVLF